MVKTLKAIGGLLLGILAMAVCFAIIGLFLFGTAWVGAKVMPVLDAVSCYSFIALLLVGTPLLCFEKTRPLTVIGWFYWSWGSGLVLWIYSLITVLQMWGLIAALVGIFFGGVGIVPVALLACGFHGEWGTFGLILGNLVLVLLARFLSLKVISDYE